MNRLAWAPVWLATFAYAGAIVMMAAKPVRLGARGVGGICAGVLAYMVLMLGLVLVVKPSGGQAAAIYAAGMAVATMLAMQVAGRVVPRAMRGAAMVICFALGLIYPAIVAATATATAPVQSMLSLYLAATALGGCVTLLMAQRENGRGLVAA